MFCLSPSVKSYFRICSNYYDVTDLMMQLQCRLCVEHGPCRSEQWFELGIVLVSSNSGKQTMTDLQSGNEFLFKPDVFNFTPPFPTHKVL